jgi:hypothetical protein
LKYSGVHTVLLYVQIVEVSFLVISFIIHTAFTAGGSNEAEIATPTRDAVLSPRMPMATAAPDGRATSNPTHKDLI